MVIDLLYLLMFCPSPIYYPAVARLLGRLALAGGPVVGGGEAGGLKAWSVKGFVG